MPSQVRPDTGLLSLSRTKIDRIKSGQVELGRFESRQTGSGLRKSSWAQTLGLHRVEGHVKLSWADSTSGQSQLTWAHTQPSWASPSRAKSSLVESGWVSWVQIE